MASSYVKPNPSPAAGLPNGTANVTASLETPAWRRSESCAGNGSNQRFSKPEGTHLLPGLKNLRTGACLFCLAALFAGCDSSVGPNDRGSVSVSFAATTGPGPAMAPGAVPLSDPFGRTIDMGLVQIVFAEIELERVEGLEDCDAGGNDDCEEIEVGPVLIDFPVDGDVVTPLSAPVPEGSFDELELEIEEPDEDDAATTAFLASHPSWPPESSVRVAGTFDPADGSGAQPFDIFIQVEVEIEFDFEPPIVLDPGSDLNITVMVDVNEWFLQEDSSLIDPRALSADGGLRERVADNIRASLEAFEDDDKDGEDED